MKKWLFILSITLSTNNFLKAQSCETVALLKTKYAGYFNLLQVQNLKPSSNYFIVEGKQTDINRYGIVDANGNEIVPTNYENYFYLGDNSKVVGVNKETNTYDIWDVTTKTKTHLSFKETSFQVSEGLLGFKADNDLWGFCNMQGNIVIPANYTSISDEFTNGFAIVTSNTNADKYGIINKDGKTVVDFKYSFITTAGNKLYIASLGNDDKKADGLIDAKGNILVPIEHKMVAERNGIIEVQNKKLISAYYNLDGKKLTEFVYKPNYTSLSEHGTMVVYKNNKPLIIDANAKEYKANLFTYISNDGNTTTLPKDVYLYSTKPLKSGMPAKVGLMPLVGNAILKDEYDRIDFFTENKNIIVTIKYGTKTTSILQTLTGKIIAKDVISTPLAIVGNYAFGKNENGYIGAIDITTGKTALPFDYSEVDEISECRIALINDGKTFLFDKNLKAM